MSGRGRLTCTRSRWPSFCCEGRDLFQDYPVRFLSIAGNGRLCFGYDGEIYVKEASGSPKKVKVDIIGDKQKDNIASLRFTSGATSATVSPDGKQVAMIIRGDVFVTSTDYTTTKQVTTTPEGEKWFEHLLLTTVQLLMPANGEEIGISTRRKLLVRKR